MDQKKLKEIADTVGEYTRLKAKEAAIEIQFRDKDICPRCCGDGRYHPQG